MSPSDRATLQGLLDDLPGDLRPGFHLHFLSGQRSVVLGVFAAREQFEQRYQLAFGQTLQGNQQIRISRTPA